MNPDLSITVNIIECYYRYLIYDNISTVRISTFWRGLLRLWGWQQPQIFPYQSGLLNLSRLLILTPLAVVDIPVFTASTFPVQGGSLQLKHKHTHTNNNNSSNNNSNSNSNSSNSNSNSNNSNNNSNNNNSNNNNSNNNTQTNTHSFGWFIEYFSMGQKYKPLGAIHARYC